MSASEPTQQLQTLAEHQEIFRQGLTSSRERVPIVSPFIRYKEGRLLQAACPPQLSQVCI